MFGASGGLGAAFVEALRADDRCGVVYAGARNTACGSPGLSKVRAFHFDLEDEASIASAAVQCSSEGPLHLVLVATGMLHQGELRPEKTWRSISPDSFHSAFTLNTVGPALIAKHLLDHLAPDQKSLLAVLSARVGSVSDNRLGGWHAYRASKAALNMLVRTFSIELKHRNPGALCIALHPGSVATALSQPFQASIPPPRLFSPAQSTQHLLRVIDRVQVTQSGGFFAWDGSQIPF